MTEQTKIAGAVCTGPAGTIVFAAAMVAWLIFIGVLVGSQSAAAQTEASSGGSRHKGKLGKVLTKCSTADTFGFDVNENGDDGIIDDAVSLSNGGLKSAIETFDINTGKITKIVKMLVSKTSNNELVTFGIGGNDVGLVDEERRSLKRTVQPQRPVLFAEPRIRQRDYRSMDAASLERRAIVAACTESDYEHTTRGRVSHFRIECRTLALSHRPGHE